MARWFIALCLGGSASAAFACNDDTVEVVDKTVCYSEMRWVGDKRGSPEMFPGEDCVGCHIDNDGPQLAVGGTVYAYILNPNAPGFLVQSGTNCFGLEGVNVQIEDADGQVFDLVTNRAGNFYIEGNPDDFAKPFSAKLFYQNPRQPTPAEPIMSTTPSYGGCGKCHNPAATGYELQEGDTPDELVRPVARIGIPGNAPARGDFDNITEELNYLGCSRIPQGQELPTVCEGLLEDYGPPGTTAGEVASDFGQ